MVDQDSGRIALPALADGGGPQPGQQASPSRRRGLPSPWQVKNWRIRWRVLALVIIPSVAAIVLGVLRIQVAQDTSDAAARTSQLGVLGTDITSLAESIEDERDLTAGYVATRESGKNSQMASIFGQLQAQYAVTGARLATVQRLAGTIGSSYPATAQADLGLALSSVSALTELRSLAHSEMSSLPLIDHYSSVISPLLTFDSDIAEGSSSATLAQTVTSLDALVQTEEEASQQRAILYAALLEGQFEPGAVDALTSAQSSEASDQTAFQQTATSLEAFVPGSGLSSVLTENQQFNNTIAGPDVDAALATELDATVLGANNQSLVGNSPQTWFSDMSFTLAQMRTVESDNLASVVAQANALQQGAQNSERLTAIAVGVLLLLVLFVTIFMARSMIRPLRRLRTDALDVAGQRLPDMVRRLSENQEGTEDVRIEPIGIDSTDEIGEVARAFDRVHSEAVRLAGEEAQLRANLNAMFVNLSRRSQTLIERQLGIIDSLEQSEQDADRLSSLFRLDHLATRMRRNSENLLVLAGHEAPRKWSQPVPLVDVLRAAISEIEQYERIALQVQPGIVIAGRAASDVVHLAAELVENAATFSPADTQVVVTAQIVTSGGVLVEIVDEGLGIPDEDLQYANWRLDNPPVIDVAVSRRMGLFVVGRLAARHGVRVRLRHAYGGGLSALIWLPDTVAETEKAPQLDRLQRRFDGDGQLASAPMAGIAGASAVTIGARRPAGWAWDTSRNRLAARSADRPGADGPTHVTGSSPVTVPPPAALPSRTTGPQSAALPSRATGPQSTTLPSRGTGAQSTAMPPSAEQEPDGGGTVLGSPDNRPLPIYDSVESDWFRRSGKTFSTGAQPPPASWTSPADDGFRAARAAASPTTGEQTSAGLPRRVVGANLVPGSIGGSRPAQQPGVPGPGQPDGSQPEAGTPGRSADAVRDRLAKLQRGAREGRAAAPWNYGADEN
jgi:signal transduction histidine kinase